jgi:multiple sugar transport system ATP-binding protein
MQVELSGVSKEFVTLRGRVSVLRRLDLTIADGELFVLLGPSGSGKSTLLNLVAGLERPTEGSIRFGDRPVADAARRLFLSARERNVAFVFQSYALYPHLNVYENIAFPLRIAKMQRGELDEAVRQAAALLSITDLLSARPRELSGGQRQRVAIARAVVRHPGVFLLDEPLSNLDAQLRAQMRVELKNLQRRLGVTTIYVTHDQTEAMSLGHRIAVLQKAGIEQVGTPTELYEQPRTPFVAQFIGSPPMNLLPARLREDEKGPRLELDGQPLAVPPELRERLAHRRTGQLLLGVRPEHVSLDPPAGAALQAVVQSVEPLGRETVVRLAVGERLLTAVCRDCRAVVGQTVALGIEPNRWHVFDGDAS